MNSVSTLIHRIWRATWLRLSLLDRWLLRELLGPLLFFIALFTLLLLTGGVMFELIRKIVDKNLPVGIAAQVLILSTPRWLAFSVPIGTLMASLFVFTRLSSNSELTALRSLGVSNDGNKEAMYRAGAIELVVMLMQSHAKHEVFHEQACLALATIISTRDRVGSAKLAGVDEQLHQSMEIFATNSIIQQRGEQMRKKLGNVLYSTLVARG